MAKRGLYKKRKDALSTLLIGAAGTGAGSATPTPGLEAPKQAVIAVADFALMARIYDIYFDEDIGAKEVARTLMQTGLVIPVAGGLAYGATKATEALLSEVLNWVPGIGWIISGTITTSVTLTVGSLWLYMCDIAFRQGKSPVAIWRSSTRRKSSRKLGGELVTRLPEWHQPAGFASECALHAERGKRPARRLLAGGWGLPDHRGRRNGHGAAPGYRSDPGHPRSYRNDHAPAAASRPG